MIKVLTELKLFIILDIYEEALKRIICEAKQWPLTSLINSEFSGSTPDFATVLQCSSKEERIPHKDKAMVS